MATETEIRNGSSVYNTVPIATDIVALPSSIMHPLKKAVDMLQTDYKELINPNKIQTYNYSSNMRTFIADLRATLLCVAHELTQNNYELFQQTANAIAIFLLPYLLPGSVKAQKNGLRLNGADLVNLEYECQRPTNAQSMSISDQVKTGVFNTLIPFCGQSQLFQTLEREVLNLLHHPQQQSYSTLIIAPHSIAWLTQALEHSPLHTRLDVDIVSFDQEVKNALEKQDPVFSTHNNRLKITSLMIPSEYFWTGNILDKVYNLILIPDHLNSCTDQEASVLVSNMTKFLDEGNSTMLFANLAQQDDQSEAVFYDLLFGSKLYTRNIKELINLVPSELLAFKFKLGDNFFGKITR